MSEIAIADLEPRWQTQAGKLREAADAGDASYVIAVSERLLSEYPGCLEVREILRSAQRLKARKNTTGFARWLNGMGVQLRTGGLYRKDPQRTMKEAEEWLNRDPENTVAHRLLGEAALQLDLPATAVFAFRAILALDPNDRATRIALGGALIKADRADEAIRLAEDMLAENPHDGDAHALLKDASVAHSLRQGNWVQGGDHRGKLTHVAAAMARELGQRKATPTEDLRTRAARLELEMSKSSPDVRRCRELAEIWQRIGDPIPALDWIDRALALPEGAADLALQRLKGELNSTVYRQRVSAARAEVDAFPDSSESRAMLQEAEREANMFECERLKWLVEQYPKDTAFCLEYGRLLLTQGEADEAALFFQRAIIDRRQRPQALLGLGQAFKLRGRHELALQQFERALAESSEMDAYRKTVLYEKADTSQLLNRDSEAKVAFEEIYAFDVSFRDVAARLDALD